MYATVSEHLVAAVSDSPLGPFIQANKQPMHSVNEIDGSVFTDDDGKHYLYFVRFDSGNVLYAAELSEDLLTMKEDTITFCFSAQPGTWERGTNEPQASVIEGAYAIKHKGLYYLIYTANHFMSIDYSMGYATSTSPLGPWAKKQTINPILQANEFVHGPGNGMFIDSPDGSEMYIAYHTHHDLNNIWPRKLALDRAWFEKDISGGDDILVVNGPSVGPQPYPSDITPNISSHTIAYWRFEEGVNGEKHPGDQDNFYLDSSGKNNHLSSWYEPARPTATNDIPFSTVTQTSKQNSLALDFTPYNDLGTFGAQTGGKMIESFMFTNGWTVECSFKLDSYAWQVIVGKDGKPNPAQDQPTFYIKQMEFAPDDKRLEIGFFDNATNFVWVTGATQIQLGKWYDVAVTYDGDKAKLYIKEEEDSYYGLEATTSVPPGANLGQWNNSWTVGRGMWSANPADFVDGRIDEVRISNIPLLEKYFLASKNIVFPFVDITSANAIVSNDVFQYTINGTNNAKVAGVMSWENDASAENGTFPAGASWFIPNISLDIGDNIISINGTNSFGDVSSDSVTITREVPEPVLFFSVILIITVNRYRLLVLKNKIIN